MSKAIPIDDMEEEDISCPICTDELDITDIHFKPCACGYQVENFFFSQSQILCGIYHKKNDIYQFTKLLFVLFVDV